MKRVKDMSSGAALDRLFQISGRAENAFNRNRGNLSFNRRGRTLLEEGGFTWDVDRMNEEAHELTKALKKTKRHQAKGKGVRASKGKVISQTDIADMAIEMLVEYTLFSDPPVDDLVDLFRGLLNVDAKPSKRSKRSEARTSCAFILAQGPEFGVRALAKSLDVSPSTVSRWKKDPEFLDLINRNKKAIQAGWYREVLTPVDEDK